MYKLAEPQVLPVDFKMLVLPLVHVYTRFNNPQFMPSPMSEFLSGCRSESLLEIPPRLDTRYLGAYCDVNIMGGKNSPMEILYRQKNLVSS